MRLRLGADKFGSLRTRSGDTRPKRATLIVMTEQPNSAITDIVPVDELRTRAEALWDWVQVSAFNIDNALQLALIIAAIAPALLFGPRLRHVINEQTKTRIKTGLWRRLLSAALELMTPLALYLILTAIRVGLGALDRPVAIVSAAISLMSAWLIIRAVTLVIRSRFWSTLAFYIIWPIAALDVFGLLDDVIAQLQALAIPLGETSEGEPVTLSLFDVLRTMIYFGLLFSIASFAGRTIDKQLQRSDEISPALSALISKVLGVLLPVLALLIALQMTGFNLATLAIFSGAVGIGVGLGLQKTVSNFAAGFTLLADKSIKPGDAISVDDQFGWVTGMQARYVSIRTRDGTEMLLPNDHFINNGVTNWSKSDHIVRMHAPFGVSYNTRDLKKVQSLAIEAAKTVNRVVSERDPVCNVMEFGDSSVNFDLRFWIRDPQNGQANVRSDVYLAIWDRLHEEGIEIPFPQMDLHVKALPERAKASDEAKDAD